MTRVIPGLRRLARTHGIQSSYFNVEAKRVWASDETLLELLAALGASVHGASDVERARHEAIVQSLRTPLDPVLVAWDGELPCFEIRTPAAAGEPLLRLVLEDGSDDAPRSLRILGERTTDVDGTPFVARRYAIDRILPFGYHPLKWEASSASGESLIISAPARCYTGEDPRPPWGLFAPLYALRSATDWGAGSYSELRRLAAFVRGENGHLVGILPILPCFYRKNAEPSPYLPVTRLLWSEFYIDVEGIDFVADCREALELLNSTLFRDEQARVHQDALVDYPGTMRLKRQVLEALARFVERDRPALRQEMEQFLVRRPLVRDYAAFRATLEATNQTWHDWPARMRSGNLDGNAGDAAVERYYEFAQWLAHRQLEDVNESPDTANLYLDLPVGVHPDGYDAWRHQAIHLTGASCGAPPDIVFTTGQDWQAPPMHPAALRRHGYAYWRSCLQHHMRHCDVLRIDHVMGLHRMYCIPQGRSAAEGAYIRYPFAELYAVLTLESHRNRTRIVGEDLGTVPHAVRAAMARHGLDRMFVLYYEMPGLESGRGLAVPRNSLACISTHDMPPFAAIWRGLDIRQQAEMGILARERLPAARAERRRVRQKLLGWLELHAPLKPSGEERSVLRSIISWLGASRARYVMANIEDFWSETRQPNVPGSGARHPSWVQRLAMTLEDMMDDSQTKEMTGILERERSRGHLREERRKQ
jgi:4-alpha-glucanotransferase